MNGGPGSSFGKRKKTMQNNSYGLISLFLIFMAVATALGAVLPRSPLMAGMYLLVAVLSFVLVLVSYCAKCPCRNSECCFVLPGHLTKFLPKRKEGPYSFLDILSTLIGIAAVLLMPQLWLIMNIPSLILFWLLMIVAGFMAVFLVCPDCPNKNCFLCGGRTKAAK